MLHLKSIGKFLIRFVLLLLLIQFITPVASQGNTIQEKISHKRQHDAGISFSVFLNENSEEKNEKNEKSHIRTLLDLSFHAVALNQSHTSIFSQFSNERLTNGLLFKLLCVFLI